MKESKAGHSAPFAGISSTLARLAGLHALVEIRRSCRAERSAPSIRSCARCFAKNTIWPQ